MSDLIPFILRQSKEQDINFILNSWLFQIGDQIPFRYIDKQTFNINQTKILLTLISKSQVYICANPDDEDQIYGYVVYETAGEDTIIHFCYTKMLFRNNNFANYLLNAAFPEFGQKPCIITFLPRFSKEANLNTKDTLIKYKLYYDPYVIDRRIQL